MRPILVLLLVIGAIGALLFGVYSLLGGSPAATTVETPRVETADTGAQRPTETLTGGTQGARTVQQGVEPAAVAETSQRTTTAAAGQFTNELSGTVVAPDGGGPLEGVEVTLSPNQTGDLVFVNEPVDKSKDLVTRTDDKGRYRFKSIAPRDRYRIIARHADYAPTEMLTNQIGETGSYEEPPLTMQHGARLVGTVTDTNGNTVPGATLHLDGVFTLADGETSSDRAVGTTDVEGRYAFEHVARGNQMRTLTVTAPGYASQTRQGILFRPEEEVMTVDFTLQSALMLAGRVVGPANEPIAGARVLAIGTQANQKGARSKTFTGDDGSFLFEDLAPGKYMVQAAKKGWRYKEIPRAEAGESSVIIEMLREASIAGRVVDASTGQPVTSFTARMRFHYADDVPTAPSDIKGEFQNPEGSFELEGVKEGTYVVEAMAPGYAPSFSMSFAVQRSRDMSGIEVRMTKGGTLSGTIVDASGAPIANARVRTEDNTYVDDIFQDALGESFPTNATTRETRTDKTGRFTLEGLHQAEYQLVVNAVGFTDRNVMGIAVTDGADQDVGSITLNRGGSLRGTLYDGSGQPIVAGHVTLEPSSLSSEGPFRKYETKSGQDGKFAFANVTPGIYRLMASRTGTNVGNPFDVLEDAKNSERSVTIVEGETVTQELTLNR